MVGGWRACVRVCASFGIPGCRESRGVEVLEKGGAYYFIILYSYYMPEKEDIYSLLYSYLYILDG